jgi:hypothetical protein
MPAALLVLLFVGQPASSVDLSKIDRTIAREPPYHSGKPKYCLLVFGPQARTRVWLVLAGDVLYVDRTGKGDLTGPGKRVKNRSSKGAKFAQYRIGPISADGKTRYPNVFVRVALAGGGNRPVGVFVPSPVELEKVGTHRQNNEQGELLFADRARDAPILHFDGRMVFRLENPRQVFVRGAKPSPLPVVVGTPGLGEGTFARLAFNSRAPAGVAKIVFPNRHAGGKPIVVEVPLQPPR